MAVCTVFLWFFIYLGCDEVGDSQTTGLVDEQWLDLLVDRPHTDTQTAIDFLTKLCLLQRYLVQN